ncbi:mitochondrial import inner membrane translocase subunit Tim29 [Petromyzon marinus]|uniref:Mitochondrial import inner membrane translocase subunit Tim29 n=1 Tax=Petromyzon marinus TaxID=7757 RepID=A0AAJ7TQG8_PETMA|nr:mitochondrial import inner membrane translocase subunit Tim29 [Petromyzon marinus]
MAARVVRRALSLGAGVRPAASVSRWQRLLNSRIGVWCKSLLSDYTDACKDVVVGAWERPLRAAIYTAVLAGAVVSARTAPDEHSFQVALLEASGELLLLSPSERSPTTDCHVQALLKHREGGTLRFSNLLFCSVVYSSPYAPECQLYAAQCKNLKPRWVDFPSRVLDVGFGGRWWMLHKKAHDYDINDGEFEQLSPAQRIVLHEDLHSQRNEQLHELRYRQPVTLTDEQVRQAEQVRQEPLSVKV